jgi:lipoprotein-anchoring transpeptidase ErfK/SrfK
MIKTWHRRAWLAAALPLLLAGCEDVGVTMSNTSPVQLTAPETHYAAQADERFTVPAIPVAELNPEMMRQEVTYPSTEAPGTVVIDPSTKHLYLITQKGRALRYGISVGRSGFGWSGEAEVTGRTHWPTWTPPPEMISRRPELERYRGGQPGGLTNPLGARALYLKTNGIDYGYRIHGTPEWESIGHNASSGCIRMINQDVIDLYERIPDGTHVVVLNEDGSFPTKLSVPPPAKKPARKAAPKPEPVPVDTPAPPALGPSGRV